MEEKISGYKEELLVSSSDVVELGYITDMLSEMGISYRVEEKAEQFVSMFYGKSAPLVNIYVDERKLGEAQELIKPSEAVQTDFRHEADGLLDEDEEYDPQQEVLYKYRRAFLYSLLTPVGIIIALGILLVSISFIYLIIRFILQ